jgi:hypothetical protein
MKHTAIVIAGVFSLICTNVSRSYMDTTVTETLKSLLEMLTAVFITVYSFFYPQIYKYFPQRKKVFTICNLNIRIKVAL